MSRHRGQKPHLRTRGVSTAGLENRTKTRRGPAGSFGAKLPTFAADVIRRAVDAGMCPWCGRGSFRILAIHTQRQHGIDRFELREMAGLPFSASICDPEVSAQRADNARKQGIPGPPSRTPRPRRMSAVAKETCRSKLDAVRTPDQAARALAKARARWDGQEHSKKVTRINADRRGRPLQHGDLGMYRSPHNCRCDECRATNTRVHRDYLARRQLKD